VIIFLNERTQTQFHSLPVEKQRMWNSVAGAFDATGSNIHIDLIEDHSEGS